MRTYLASQAELSSRPERSAVEGPAVSRYDLNERVMKNPAPE